MIMFNVDDFDELKRLDESKEEKKHGNELIQCSMILKPVV